MNTDLTDLKDEPEEPVAPKTKKPTDLKEEPVAVEPSSPVTNEPTNLQAEPEELVAPGTTDLTDLKAEPETEEREPNCHHTQSGARRATISEASPSKPPHGHLHGAKRCK